jgi:hypothetical protein
MNNIILLFICARSCCMKPSIHACVDLRSEEASAARQGREFPFR